MALAGWAGVGEGTGAGAGAGAGVGEGDGLGAGAGEGGAGAGAGAGVGAGAALGAQPIAIRLASNMPTTTRSNILLIFFLRKNIGLTSIISKSYHPLIYS